MIQRKRQSFGKRLEQRSTPDEADTALQKDNLRREAQAAEDTNNWNLAVAKWLTLRNTSPQDPSAPVGLCKALIELGRLDHAESVISNALEYFPLDTDIIALAIHTAIMRENWIGAASRLRLLQTKLSDHPYTNLASTQLQEMITNGLLKNSQARLRHQAQTAELQKDWQTSVKIWQEIHESDPAARDGFLEYARAAQELGDYDRAEDILSKAKLAYPNDAEIAVTHAQIAAKAENWFSAAERWQKALSQFPELDICSDQAAEACRRVGALVKAENIAQEALKKYPDRTDIRIIYASILQDGGRWAEAVTCWDVVCNELPNNKAVLHERHTAIWHAGLENPEARIRAEKLSNKNNATLSCAENVPERTRRLLLAFENLGDNCEFGLVQRHYGAEPLGLFRFAAIYPKLLIELLAQELRPLGDKSHTFIEESDDDYIITDDRSYFWMHTFVQKGINKPQELLEKHIKRINFLKAELIEDMRSSEKIFVCKDSSEHITESILVSIADQLSKFGPNLLLGVRLADEIHEAGTIEKLTKNILVGYVGKVFSGINGQTDIDFVSWLQILQKAHDYKQADFNISHNNLLEYATQSNSLSYMLPFDDTEAMRIKHLMLAFEGLGDNCEFGIMQRHFGAEPLGLFRFAAIKPALLPAMFAEKFNLLGDPAHSYVEETDFDYLFHDDRGFYTMHSFIEKGAADPKELLDKHLKHMNFLKREFIEDLRSGDKIFVCKDSVEAISDNLLCEISEGLKLYGNNILLGIRCADDLNPPGSLLYIKGNILVGHVNSMFKTGNDFSAIDLLSWLHILETSYKYKENYDRMPAPEWQSRDDLLKQGIIAIDSKNLALAEQIFSKARLAFPEDPEIFANFAQVAAKAFDWPKAAQRWREGLRQFPALDVCSDLAGEAFRLSGALAEAEEIAGRATLKYPDRVDIRIVHANIAQDAGRWEDAALRWDEIARIMPEDIMIRNARGSAMWHAGLQGADKSVATKLRRPASQSNDDSARLKQLVLAFEGLGDNCEFGLMQRHFGAEPLGLLRFAAISSELLIALLQEKFERLGDPAHTKLHEAASGDYMVEDDRGFYRMHTFLKRGDSEPEKLLAQQIKRINFLKRELIEDLQAGDKIFVYKDSNKIISDSVLSEISSQLNKYGPNLLLGIRLADASNIAGSVAILNDNILVGYVGTMYIQATSSLGSIDFEAWQKILEAASAYKETQSKNVLK